MRHLFVALYTELMLMDVGASTPAVWPVDCVIDNRDASIDVTLRLYYL